MPKPQLTEPMATLEHQIIKTLLIGLKQWRPDLNYPESYSDMQGCVRHLLRVFKVELSLEQIALPFPCDNCHGTGYSEWKGHCSTTCDQCRGGVVKY